jgi:hypothetical protein
VYHIYYVHPITFQMETPHQPQVYQFVEVGYLNDWLILSISFKCYYAHGVHWSYMQCEMLTLLTFTENMVETEEGQYWSLSCYI